MHLCANPVYCVLFFTERFLTGAQNMALSPAAAAKIAGVSRSLISRAIKAGDLKATLRNNGHHGVERTDLDDWMSRRTERATAPEQANEAPAVPAPAPVRDLGDIARIEALEGDLRGVREQVARLQGEATATASRLADLAADRDAWRAQANKLADLQARPSSFLARLLGRS